MEIKKELGSRITSALSLRGKRQKDLAEELGVTANTISYFCSGSRTPNIEQLIKTSDFLNVTTDYLLGKTEDPNIIPTATGDLGLTSEAINWIKSKSSDPFFGLEFRTRFSKLLEMEDFQNLIDSLFDCFAVAKATEIDLYSYQSAYAEYPEDIIERYKVYKSRLESYENLESLDSRVSFYVQANNELERLYEKFPVLSSVLGSGEDFSKFKEAAGVQGIVETRASKQLARLLEKIEFDPNEGYKWLTSNE